MFFEGPCVFPALGMNEWKTAFFQKNFFLTKKHQKTPKKRKNAFFFLTFFHERRLSLFFVFSKNTENPCSFKVKKKCKKVSVGKLGKMCKNAFFHVLFFTFSEKGPSLVAGKTKCKKNPDSHYRTYPFFWYGDPMEKRLNVFAHFRFFWKRVFSLLCSFKVKRVFFVHFCAQKVKSYCVSRDSKKFY